MPSVSIGWVDGGDVRGEFTESVSKLAGYEVAKQRLANILRIQSGPLLAEGRNLLVERFLSTTAEWLMMVDTDMVFPLDSVERLLATAETEQVLVVGGLCFGINQELGMFPTLYRNRDGLPEAMLDIPDGVVDVTATGAAFVLTHRSVFEDHRIDSHHPWFHRRPVPASGNHPGGLLGEDLSWFWHLSEHGVRVVVDTDVVAGHVKPTVVDRETYEAHRSNKDS